MIGVAALYRPCLYGNCQTTLPLATFSPVRFDSDTTNTTFMPSTVITFGEPYDGLTSSARHFSSPLARSNAIVAPSLSPGFPPSPPPTPNWAMHSPSTTIGELDVKKLGT